MGLKHQFHSVKVDPADPTIIGATKWNADHYYVDAAGAPIGNVGALLLAGAAGALTHLNSVAAGQVLTSAGAGALPVWATPVTPIGPSTPLEILRLGVGTPPLPAAGTIIAASSIVSGGNVDCGGTFRMADPIAAFYWQGSTIIEPPANGVLKLSNFARNDFSLLQFGGTTAAFPALKRSGTTVQVRKADDSGFAQVDADQLVLANGVVYFDTGGAVCVRRGVGDPNGQFNAGTGALYLRTDGGAGTSLYVKQTATGNTGWVGK